MLFFFCGSLPFLFNSPVFFFFLVCLHINSEFIIIFTLQKLEVDQKRYILCEIMRAEDEHILVLLLPSLGACCWPLVSSFTCYADNPVVIAERNAARNGDDATAIIAGVEWPNHRTISEVRIQCVVG